MNRFLADNLTAGRDVVLSPEQSHHLAKVLRLEEGETLGLVDGHGGFARGTLARAHAKAAIVRVESVEHSSVRSQVTLCFGVTKGQALDFIYRKATELGVRGLQPLQTQHSSPIKGWNPDRWTAVVQEVCKQCQELYFPETPEPLALAAWLRSRDASRALVLCDENEREGDGATATAAAFTAGTPVDLLVGAEGGWSSEEVASLRAAGARSLGLGRNRLRAETATLVALTLAKVRLGEIGA